jgi:hypothetical protein
MYPEALVLGDDTCAVLMGYAGGGLFAASWLVWLGGLEMRSKCGVRGGGDVVGAW